MTPASQLIAEIEAKGVVFRTGEDWLQFRPRDAVEPELLSEIKRHKPEILAVLKVKHALAGGRCLTGRELLAETGLARSALYQSLGELYDWYEVSTDPDGFYWLVEPTVN